MADAERSAADGILAIKPKLIGCFEELSQLPTDWVDIRQHGDFHLAQMLVVKDDIFIINLDAAHEVFGAARRENLSVKA